MTEGTRGDIAIDRDTAAVLGKRTYRAPPGTKCSACQSPAETGWLLPDKADGFPACDACAGADDIWAVLARIRPNAKRVAWLP
jgi:hypothetical protein